MPLHAAGDLPRCLVITGQNCCDWRTAIDGVDRAALQLGLRFAIPQVEAECDRVPTVAAIAATHAGSADATEALVEPRCGRRRSMDRRCSADNDPAPHEAGSAGSWDPRPGAAVDGLAAMLACAPMRRGGRAATAAR